MIEITTNGHRLTLHADTTLNIELNNALFASEAIEGDVVWPFEMPATPENARAIGFESLPQVRAHTLRPCVVAVGGLQLAAGTLVVQKAGRRGITAAVVCNPYPEGFASRSVTENTCGEVAVSGSPEEHEEAWLRHLRRCLSPDSDVKFAPFVDEDAYGSDNEDFGFRNGRNMGKVVNRAAFRQNGSLEPHDCHNPHNREIILDGDDGLYVEKNQNTLCPQIRIGRVLDDIARNAGYRLVDHIGAELSKIHIQCTRTLDADITQYATPGAVKIRRQNLTDTAGQFAVTNGMTYWSQTDYYDLGEITLPHPGRYHIEISATPLAGGMSHQDDLYLWLYKGGKPTADNLLVKSQVSLDWDEKTQTYGETLYAGRPYVPPSFCGVPLRVKIAKYSPLTLDNGTTVDVWTANDPAFVKVSVTGPLAGSIGNSLNIYAKSYRPSELLPDVTNSDMVSALTRGLGLNWFADARKRLIEVSPVRETLKAAAIDISGMVIRTETSVRKTDAKKVRLKVSPVTGFDTKGENYMGETGDLSADPEMDTAGAVWLLTPANAYMKAEEEEDERHAWKTRWNAKGGNAETLDLGEGEEQLENTAYKVPANYVPLQDSAHEWTNLPRAFGPYGLPHIPLQLNSPMSEDKTGNPSDIILLYSRGLSAESTDLYGRPYEGNGEFDMMHATYPGQFGLKAAGGGSLGETYLKDCLMLRNLNDEVTYRLYADAHTAQRIVSLLQPQEAEPSAQTRLVHCDGVSSIPKKIQLQVDNRSRLILVEITAVRVR